MNNISYSIATCFAVFVFFVSFMRISDSQLILKKGAPHLKLDQGFYVGIIRPSRQENYYYEFLGLRYAKPPGRFEIATLPEAEAGKKEAINAIKAPPMCPQLKAFSTDGPAGEEDCLFLNVYVPMRNSPYKDGFPVMVWFHGGGYSFGEGVSHEPQFFMDEDVILVTVNYRLGALGFLSTGDNVIPGNLGLKDQLLSLKWVQKNIKNFGGDNKRVTIFGCSAGGSSVQMLTLSPLAKGLFHNAIIQSGSAVSFWAVDDKPVAISKSREFSNNAGCPTTTSEEMLKCLKTKSVEEILTAQAKLYKWFGHPVVPFAPTVEAPGSSEMVFLDEHPLNLLKSKRFTKVPILTGIVAEEGLSLFSTALMRNKTLLNDLNTRFLELAPIAFEYSNGFPQENLDAVSSAIRKLYFKDKPINEETFQNLTNLYTDAIFTAGTWKNIMEYATEKPVYAYVLSFVDESSNSLTDLVTDGKILTATAHGDDIQYLFRNKALFPADIPQSHRAAEFSKRLVKLWASFAQHRKPKATWGSASKWPSISKAQLNGDKPFLWYDLNEDTRILENPFMDRINFWEKLIKKYSFINKPNKTEL